MWSLEMPTPDARRPTLTEGQVWCAPDLALVDVLDDVLATAIRVVGLIHADDGPDYDETARDEHILSQLLLGEAALLRCLLGRYRNAIVRRLNEPNCSDPF